MDAQGPRMMPRTGVLLVAGGAMACSQLVGLDELVADRDPMVGGPGVSIETSSGSFQIDATEVTNAAYQAFLDTGPSTDGQRAECTWNQSYEPGVLSPNAAVEAALDSACANWLVTQIGLGNQTRPVGCVDWCDAVAYCDFAGKRLCGKIGGGALQFSTNGAANSTDPSSSQWLNACSHGGERDYPYGETYTAGACADDGIGVVDVGTLSGCSGGYAGLFDMSGNVAEWEDACLSEPTPDIEHGCARRGGAYYNNSDELRCDSNAGALRGVQANTIGFRCCSP